jgi:cobalamin biosynthesis protein CobT
MDNKEAKKNLQELKESLEKVLGDDGLQEEAQEHAKAAKQGAKTLIGRLKGLPVVEKISSLGTAGTVAVGTAAATQAELAVNYTEIVVAQVAEDVYKGVIEPPFLFDMIDYENLHIWGQEVIAEKVAEVSELQSTSAPSAESSDTKSQPSASSQDTGDGKPSQSKPTESSQESKAEKSETKESKSSSDQETSKEDKQEKSQPEQTEDKGESQEKSSSEQSKPSQIPIVNTPIDTFQDDIKPHSSVRHVSPTR